MNKFKILLSLLVTAVAISATGALAGHTAVTPEGPIFAPSPSSPEPTDHTTVDPTGPVITPQPVIGTDLFVVAKNIRETAKFCDALPEEYLVDCMSERLEAIADELPGTAEFAEVKQVLKEASRKLEVAVREERDTAKPRIRARTESAAPIKTTRPLTPVKPAAQEEVKAEALEILEEAETILLRSAETSQERSAQFVEIAEAIESNKVLLRS